MRSTRFLSAMAAIAILASSSVLEAQSGASRPDTQRSRGGRGGVQGMDEMNAPEIAEAINDLLSDTSAHMRMAPARVAVAADSARAAAIVTLARTSLAKYKDVSLAEADGYIKFLPGVETQSLYHYTNYQHAFASMFALDPTKPTSLLYKKDKRGKMMLVGVMYTAPWMATPEQLDERLPLGMAQWHEHVNFCGPRFEDVRSGKAKRDAASFARWLKITSEEECEAAGGRFVPRLFGWMAHAYVFAGTDPNTVWGGEGKGHMHMKM